MVNVKCVNCGKVQIKRERDDNGFNFCSNECKEEGWFKYGYKAKNLYFIIGDYAFVVTKNKNNEVSGYFVIDKFNIWILNFGSWAISNEYIINNTLGNLHRFLNNTPKELETDHINKIKHWNTLRNLRNADRFLNNQNKNLRIDNRSKVTGVSYDIRYNYWKATISYNKKAIKLGIFDTPKEAILARIRGEKKYWGYIMTEFDENIDYLKLFLNKKASDKSKKDFIGISPNGKSFLYNNQKEFSDLFNLDKKLVNITLKKGQKSHRDWKFYYFNESNLIDKEYKDLRPYSYCIGMPFNKEIKTKKCGNIIPIPKFNLDNKIAVIFNNDNDKNIYYFSKSDILNKNCYHTDFVQINNGITGQTYVKKATPYYNLWLKFLDKKLEINWVYNFNEFKTNIQTLDSFNREDLYNDIIYFDFNDFVFRYKYNNKVRVKQKVSDQYDFIGEFEGNKYLFDNQNEVCRKYNLDSGGLNRCLKGKYKQTKGWKFSKINENTNFKNIIDNRIYKKTIYDQNNL